MTDTIPSTTTPIKQIIKKQKLQSALRDNLKRRKEQPKPGLHRPGKSS